MARHTNSGECAKCLEIVKDCSSNLRDWFISHQLNDPTIHASCGYRGQAAQEDLLKRKLTKAKFGESPHNLLPARAIDVFYLIDGKADYSISRYTDLAESLPPYLESGMNFPIADSNHIQEKSWKINAKKKSSVS